ncbi:hypothetical protein P7K49_037203 [Saguinus oedipus]|uniref:Uncharacterized protein n=1 Tax=Saguinus oedipus TaxID=9490 RepID=A0ABQ9THB8_SAGOE|nr:hypothetical protein P7K49_037203 [Saguinus oedipus]
MTQMRREDAMDSKHHSMTSVCHHDLQRVVRHREGEKESGMACLCPSHVVTCQVLGEWEPVQGEKSSEQGKGTMSDPGAQTPTCSQAASWVDKE